MDFFAQQDAARRTTRRLVLYFAIAVTLIVGAVYLAVRLILFGISVQTGRAGEGAMPLFDLGLFTLTAGVTLMVILGGSLYKTIVLREGGDAVAWMLGGRLIEPDSTNPDERRLLNVVEEMALASGVPVPHVYVLDKESGINAFAAGYSASDAVIGITDGALRLLSRNELQGVIGHEFSHLLNGDMRLNLRLMGILHGILVIALIGGTILRSVYWTGGGGGRDRKGGGSLGLAILLFGATLIAVGYIGVFFGRLIKSAVSRQREYLADAAAVQFTRNPIGLSGALQKIGGHGKGSRLRSPRAEEASHMFFGDGVERRFFAAALATHPPLGERIQRIDPGWDGEFPEIAPAPVEAAKAESAAARERAAGEAVIGAAVAGAAVAGAAVATGAAAGSETSGEAAPDALTPDSVTARIGTLSQAHLAYVQQLLADLPDGLRDAVHEVEGAEAAVYALLLADDPDTRTEQLDLLAARAEPAAYQRTRELAGAVAACPPQVRLPLLDLALPALGQLSIGRYEQFLAAVVALIRADRRIDLFEYALERLLRAHLDSRFHPERRTTTHYYRLDRLGGECSLLLSALAHSGQVRPEEAARAFAAGTGELPAGLEGLELLDRSACGMEAIDRALGELDRTSPPLKRRLVRAATATVAFDHRVTVPEGELLRAIADSLGCPVPPFLPGQTAAAPPAVAAPAGAAGGTSDETAQ